MPSTSSAKRMQTPTRPTQREAILDLLRAAGTDGLCSWDCYRRYMPHVSSRIPELNAEGFVIEGETKAWPDGHGNHAHYFLIRERSALSSGVPEALGVRIQAPVLADGSAVRAGGTPVGKRRGSPLTASLVGEVCVGPSRRVLAQSGIPARTAQQLTLAGGR